MDKNIIEQINLYINSKNISAVDYDTKTRSQKIR